ncbi:MAG: UpxY family transcription antiterminator [Bacteroides sp.]|nr:UpxY family transcription antiterminator [Bacteroides sp.]
MSNTETYTYNVTAVPAGVDGAVGVGESKWYVAIVNARHEKKVAERLIGIGIECFVATQNELRLWANGKRKMIERVIIPSIVFVKCTERERRELVRRPYILRFMTDHAANKGTHNSPPATIPDRQLAMFKFMLGHADSPVNLIQSPLKHNDKVRVIRGRLQGLEGSIISDPDGSHSLIVALDLLGGASVRINLSDVQGIQ